MFLAARRTLGIQPTEFWDMTLGEFLLEYDAVRPRDPARDYAGKLTQADVEELSNWDED